MNGYLRQSTASQSRLIGPFHDDTDFKTPETALTIANTDIKLRANGTTLSNKNSGGGTHQVNGEYSVTWDATDTANVGELAFSVVVAGALPVFGTYCVLEEAVYDALFAASAAGFGTAQTGDAFARLGAPAGASVSADIASVQADTDNLQTRLPTSLVGGRIDASVGAMAANTLTAAALAADAVDEILDEVIEGTVTMRQMFRAFASALASKVSGAATTTIVFRDISDTKDRITATCDVNGNRTAITLDLT